MRRAWLGGLSLLAGVCAAGAEPEAYRHRGTLVCELAAEDAADGSETSILEATDPRGQEVWLSGGLGHVYAMRLTGAGTLFLTLADGSGRPEGLAEMDLKGKLLREFRWPGGKAPVSHARAADLLANGNFLVVGYTGEQGEGGFPGSVAIEMTPEGKEVRRLELGPTRYLGAVRETAGGRLLVAGTDVFETDWSGKRFFTLALPQDKPRQFRDAAPVEGGYVVAEPGRVAAFDAGGKQLWSVPHGNPLSVQVLPDGRILAAG